MLVDPLDNEKHTVKKEIFVSFCCANVLRVFRICFVHLGSLSWTQPLTKMHHHLPPSQKAWVLLTGCSHMNQGKWSSWFPCWIISSLKVTGAWCSVSRERCWTLFSELSLMGYERYPFWHHSKILLRKICLWIVTLPHFFSTCIDWEVYLEEELRTTMDGIMTLPT